MNNTCILESMEINNIIIILLLFILSMVVIYYIYCLYNNIKTFEKYTNQNDAELANYDYGASHDGNYESTDKTLIENSEIITRPCQIYFVGNDGGTNDEEINKCDATSNNNKTCKYTFGDNWKEISFSDGSYYPKKIYNQSHTSIGEINPETYSSCFREDDGNSRFIYQQNDVVKYDHGNNDMINLNKVSNDDGNTYNSGRYISMNFNNDSNDNNQNYKNIINSICSKKYVPPKGLNNTDIYYKFVLNSNNEITNVQRATINADMKSFNIYDIDLDVFANSKSITISYNNSNGTFEATKGKNVISENVIVYKFKYDTDTSNDYLCGNEESGIIKSFITSNFNMNKKYIEVDDDELTSPLIHEGVSIVVPNHVREQNLFPLTGIINITEIINILTNEEQRIKNEYNSDIDIEIGKLNELSSKYTNKINKSNEEMNTYGIGRNFNQIANDIINKISNLSLSDSLINEEKKLASLKPRTTINKNILGFQQGYGIYSLDKNMYLGSDISDYKEIQSVNPLAFSYIKIPGGPKTCLNFIKNFGINGNSYNTNNSQWRNSFSGDIKYEASPIANINYFTKYNRVRIINGDGQNDRLDWAVFNFDIANNYNYDGNRNTYGYFGGERAASGGKGGHNVEYGHIWGYNNTNGWILLYELDLPGNGSFSHARGNWFNSGGSVKNGLGKRSSYDITNITYLGFSVGNSQYYGVDGWDILLKTSGAKKDSNYMGPAWNSYLGNSNFKNMSISSASGKNSIGQSEGFYEGFFKMKNITKLALIDGTAGNLDDITQNNNFIIYDLVESSGNETMYEILNRLDTYARNNAIHRNDGIFSYPKVTNFTAGPNGYSGKLSNRSSTNPFESTIIPDKICVWGINRDSDNDTQILATYNGNLNSGKGDSWRNQRPPNTLWSLWGNDWHYSSSSQTVSSGIQTAPGINTKYSSYNGDIYLVAYGAYGKSIDKIDNANKVYNNVLTNDVITKANELKESLKSEYKKKLYDEKGVNQLHINVEPKNIEGGVIMGFIFFESGNYNNLSFILSSTSHFEEYYNMKIFKITGPNTESEILISSNNNFNIDQSGFYRFECLYLIKNNNTNIISVNFDLSCTKNNKLINIKNDLMYKGKVYPASYSNNSSISHMNNNVKKFNDECLSGVKINNNDAISLRNLKNNYLNTTTNDFFNISYWTGFYNRANELKSNIILLEDNCDTSNVNSEYKEACTRLREVSDLKNKISIYRDGAKIDKLFEGSSFKNPTFLFNKKLEEEFTGGNITDYITIEKINNVNDRTQKTINQYPMFNFADNAEKSIYVKKVI